MPTQLYALLESRTGHPACGEPFYIGIGTKRRPKAHLTAARSAAGHRNWRLQEVLAAHLVAGTVPEVRVLGTFDDRGEAGEAEKELIARFGRVGIEPGGTLTNLAVGGQGPDPALMSMPEVVERNRAAQKRRPRESFDNLIAAGRRNAQDEAINAMRSAASTIANLAAWADETVRQVRSAAMRGVAKTITPAAEAARQANLALTHSAGAQAAHSAAMLEVWQRPEHVAKRSRNQAAAWQDPEKRANMLAGRGEGISNSWADPEVRARRIAGIRAAAARKAIDQEPRPDGSGRSATMQAVNAAKTPEQRSAEQSAAWADGATREKRLAGIRAAAQDPALKAARLAAMLEGKRRKAAERAASQPDLPVERVEHQDQPIDFCAPNPTCG